MLASTLCISSLGHCQSDRGVVRTYPLIEVWLKSHFRPKLSGSLNCNKIDPIDALLPTISMICCIGFALQAKDFGPRDFFY